MIPKILKPHFKKTSSCPLCGGTNYRKFIELKSLTFHECQTCHFRFMNPFLSDKGMGLLYQNSKTLTEVNPALENYYEYEVGKTKGKTSEDYKNTLAYAQNRMQDVAHPKLFEVGYGSGSFLMEARQHGWQIDGIDTSSENREFLKSKTGRELNCGTFQDFIPDGKLYDMVAFWDVIEHTMTPQVFVRKAYTMLKPGGLLLLATPNVGGLLNLAAESIYFLSFGKVNTAASKLYVTEHVGYYDTTTLRRLVTEQGFLPAREFLTETDLDRYAFSNTLRICLRFFFLFARVCRRPNRIILISEKPKT